MADLNSTIVRGNLRVTDDIHAGGNISAASISENNVLLVDKYLGKTSTAANSSKLNNQEASYYLNYNNLTNKPTIPSVSNATITIKQTGISDQTFTLNGSATTITLADNNTTYSAGTGLTLSGTQFNISSANASTILNLLTTGGSTPTDNDYYISQYVGGGTTTTSYHRRPMSALWSYVKEKADSVYQPKGTYATESYVDTAIANAITTALNTAV